MAAKKMREKLLVVEDDAALLKLLAHSLGGPSREVFPAETRAQAQKIISDEAPQVLLLDIGLPDGSGLDILDLALEINPHSMIVMLTGRADEEAVVEAMRRGALDYLTKPVKISVLQGLVDKAFQASHQKLEASKGKKQEASSKFEGFLVGRSAGMLEVFKLIGTLAPSEVPVHITGESGTGKELAARALHAYGPQASGPFIAVDCASLPQSLLEAELFGYEKGAFTGAEAAKAGRFEQADGGTLFLDEVGNIPMEVQAKLLRVLQEQTTQRLGGIQPISWKARIVSAANKDLGNLVQQGLFREDLLYRLSGAEIPLPPLRQRVEDIPLLVDHFLKALRTKTETPSLSQAAMKRLEEHSWPGNIRELEHAIQRAAALARGSVIEPEHLPEKMKDVGILEASGLKPAGQKEAVVSMEEIKQRYARHVLDLCGGNRTEAAKLLDVDRRTLNTLLE